MNSRRFILPPINAATGRSLHPRRQGDADNYPEPIDDQPLIRPISAFSPESFGRSWQLEASTLKLATAFLDRDLTTIPSSGTIQVDRDHKAESYNVSFQIPQGDPSFLLVTTCASRPGRLTIHLQPTRLPEALQAAILKEDWANPNQLFDFRTVLEVTEGTPQWKRVGRVGTDDANSIKSR